MEGSRLAIRELDELRFKRLLRIVSELVEPDLAPLPVLFRAWDEQSWYQRDVKHAIGRGLTWYKLIPATLQSPSLDVAEEFEKHIGLPVDDFFAVAFLIFSIASSAQQPPYHHLSTMTSSESLSERARELLASERVKEFLASVQLDQAGFQESVKNRNPGSTGVERYAFNPLLERPLVSIEESGQIAPIPNLLIQLLDEQPYRRLRDAHRMEASGNAFATFFGKEIFEPYIGWLFSDRMPDADLLPEDQTQYEPDGGHHGPDWIVRQGDVGIAVEALLAEIPRSALLEEELKDLEKIFEERIAARASRIPEKIRGVVERRPDLGLDSVRHWHRLIVTKAALPWIGITKPQLIDPHVDSAALPYHVLSIEELEALLAAEENYGVHNILTDAEALPEGSADFRELFAQLYREQGSPFNYGSLATIQDEFFSQFVNTAGEPLFGG